MKIELKHLAVYLPYGLKGLAMDGDIYELIGITNEYIVCKNEKYSKVEGRIDQYKPFLRPLSDFNKIHDDLNGSMYAMTFNIAQLEVDEDLDILIRDEHSDFISLIDCYDTFQVLLKYHFDVFNLIEQGLAIDINTL